MNKKYLYIGLRTLFVIAAIILGIIAVYYLGKLTIPFIIGFVIALIINPLVDFLQNKTKMPRGFAVFTSIIIILAVISGAITLIVNEIISGFNYLSKEIPDHYRTFNAFAESFYLENIAPMYESLLNLFRDLDHSQKSTIFESMQFFGEKLTDAVSSLLQSLGNGVYFIIRKLPNLATVFIISLLAAFFISKDWRRIVQLMHANIPKHVHSKINQFHGGLQRALLGFLKAEFKLTFISAVTVFIGLTILRVDHALTIALIIWIVDFAPYIGSILVMGPWAIYSFSTGNIYLGIGLSILYGLIVLQRQLIKPKILSSSIGISPLLTLLTMYIGFKLIGIIGIVLGPLTFIIMKILHEVGLFKAILNFITGKKKIERI